MNIPGVSPQTRFTSVQALFFAFSKISPRTPLSQFSTFLQKDYWVCLPRNPSSPPHNSFFSHVRFSSLPKTSPAKNSPTHLSPINFSNPFFASYLFYFSFFFIHLLASLTSFYRLHCYWFNEDVILNHHHGKMVMYATHPCSVLHLEIVSYLSKK